MPDTLTARTAPGRPAPPDPPSAGDDSPERGLPHGGITALTVRELLGLLAELEDELRSTPFLVVEQGLMGVNPAVAPLLSRQRAVVTQLRARRLAWRSGEAAAGRAPSAAWPRPPWA